MATCVAISEAPQARFRHFCVSLIRNTAGQQGFPAEHLARLDRIEARP